MADNFPENHGSKEVRLQEMVHKALSLKEKLYEGTGHVNPYVFSEPAKKDLGMIVSDTILECSSLLRVDNVDVDFFVGTSSDHAGEFDYQPNRIDGSPYIIRISEVIMKATAEGRNDVLRELTEDNLRSMIAHEMWHLRQRIEFPKNADRKIPDLESRAEYAARLFALNYVLNRKDLNKREKIARYLNNLVVRIPDIMLRKVLMSKR